MDNFKTDITFRVDKEGNVFALFPHEVSTLQGHVTCYQYVGQHSSADYQGCIKDSRPASEAEYAPLKKELESIGYNVNLVKKQNYDKYLADYYRVRGIN